MNNRNIDSYIHAFLSCSEYSRRMKTEMREKFYIEREVAYAALEGRKKLLSKANRKLGEEAEQIEVLHKSSF